MSGQGGDAPQGNPYYYGAGGAGTAPARPPHTGLSTRTAALLVLATVLVAVMAVLNLVHVDKVIYNPGPVHDTLGQIDGRDVVHVDGLTTYPTSGTLDFTTITITGSPQHRITAWQWLMAEIDPRTQVVDLDLVYPPNTNEQKVAEENAFLMAESQQGAAAVALRAIGEEVPQHLAVGQIVEGAPALGVLKVNDRIVSVDGVEMTSQDQLRDQLQKHKPGDSVPMEVLRDGKTLTLDVPTGASEVANDDGTTQTRTVVGVLLAWDYDMPHKVTIDPGNTGGPSAGLMFSLAIYDEITPGELTGGKPFAGTGTIDNDGTVGPIGGIQQKMIGAREAGASYFLAPAKNCSDVIGNEPDGLTVVKVSTFDDAKAAVEQIAAGDLTGLPVCTAP